MFVNLNGFKAQYHSLTLAVASEFNEWKILLRGPNTTILGSRQFSEAKAKEHALDVARRYVEEIQHEQPQPASEVQWVPTNPDEWLVWKG